MYRKTGNGISTRGDGLSDRRPVNSTKLLKAAHNNDRKTTINEKCATRQVTLLIIRVTNVTAGRVQHRARPIPISASVPVTVCRQLSSLYSLGTVTAATYTTRIKCTTTGKVTDRMTRRFLKITTPTYLTKNVHSGRLAQNKQFIHRNRACCAIEVTR